MKNKNTDFILAICFLIMLIFTISTKITDESLSSDIDSLKSQLEESELKNDLLKDKVELTQSKNVILQQQLLSKGNNMNLYQIYVQSLVDE